MVPHNSATLFPLFWHKHLCRHSEPWDQSLAHLDSAYSHLLWSWDWLPQGCLWGAKRYQYFTPPNSVSYSDFGIFPISLTLFLPFPFYFLLSPPNPDTSTKRHLFDDLLHTNFSKRGCLIGERNEKGLHQKCKKNQYLIKLFFYDGVIKTVGGKTVRESLLSFFSKSFAEILLHFLWNKNCWNFKTSLVSYQLNKEVIF